MSDQAEEKIVVYVDPNLKSLIPKFVEHQRDMLKNIQASAKTQNFLELKHLGHQMKGACGSYGFLLLAELATQIEKFSQDENIEVLHQLIIQMETCLSSMKIEYRKR
jgi:HPt (histidine-containing phosphotransfer) domain-containing protein